MLFIYTPPPLRGPWVRHPIHSPAILHNGVFTHVLTCACAHVHDISTSVHKLWACSPVSEHYGPLHLYSHVKGISAFFQTPNNIPMKQQSMLLVWVNGTKFQAMWIALRYLHHNSNVARCWIQGPITPPCYLQQDHSDHCLLNPTLNPTLNPACDIKAGIQCLVTFSRVVLSLLLESKRHEVRCLVTWSMGSLLLVACFQWT